MKEQEQELESVKVQFGMYSQQIPTQLSTVYKRKNKSYRLSNFLKVEV